MKKGAKRDRMRVNLKNCINDSDPRVWKFLNNVWKPPEFLGIKNQTSQSTSARSPDLRGAQNRTPEIVFEPCTLSDMDDDESDDESDIYLPYRSKNHKTNQLLLEGEHLK